MNNIIFKAKVTPKKMGQFVSIWKRDSKNITIPYDISDNFEFMIIELENNMGKFVFLKNILLKNKIISGENSSGKNGIRVYTTTDPVKSKQAIATKNWQVKYFLNN